MDCRVFACNNERVNEVFCEFHTTLFEQRYGRPVSSIEDRYNDFYVCEFSKEESRRLTRMPKQDKVEP